jgi:hypothetical protein
LGANLKVLTCIWNRGAGFEHRLKGAGFCFVTHPKIGSWNEELHAQRQDNALTPRASAAAFPLVGALQPAFLFHWRSLAEQTRRAGAGFDVEAINFLLDATAFESDLANVVAHKRLVEVGVWGDDVFVEAAIDPRDWIWVGVDNEAIIHRIPLWHRCKEEGRIQAQQAASISSSVWQSV